MAKTTSEESVVREIFNLLVKNRIKSAYMLFKSMLDKDFVPDSSRVKFSKIKNEILDLDNLVFFSLYRKADISNMHKRFASNLPYTFSDVLAEGNKIRQTLFDALIDVIMHNKFTLGEDDGDVL